MYTLTTGKLASALNNTHTLTIHMKYKYLPLPVVMPGQQEEVVVYQVNDPTVQRWGRNMTKGQNNEGERTNSLCTYYVHVPSERTSLHQYQREEGWSQEVGYLMEAVGKGHTQRKGVETEQSHHQTHIPCTPSHNISPLVDTMHCVPKTVREELSKPLTGAQCLLTPGLHLE